MPPQIKQDLNRSGWETTDFPSVCETCLPDNPYVKMLKEDYGAECKLVSLSRRFSSRFRIETMLTYV
jgi:pre-mRNA-splicing factor RBM22/SLT11